MLRIGVLGAARIAPSAIIAPAAQVDGVTVDAIAARDQARAAAFAAKHGVARVLGSYDQLVRDPDLDAVYIPLPNGAHAEWIRRALAAGKHVLCEKPFTANAEQAREIAALAEGSGRVVMEAFHYRYHPLAARMLELIPQLGAIRHVETALCFPLPSFADIRYNFGLAGGSLMDAGCYALHTARTFGPGEPVVAAARALTLKRDQRIDRAMSVDLAYPGGATGHAQASMWSSTVVKVSVRVTGDRGTLKVFNYIAPQFWHRLTWTVDGKTRRERVGSEATYTHQLRAFIAAVGGDASANLTPPADSVATMTLIDDAYRAAGLPLRA
jgi:predicted dehydrogenase